MNNVSHMIKEIKKFIMRLGYKILKEGWNGMQKKLIR